jgi:hypothetical protein
MKIQRRMPESEYRLSKWKHRMEFIRTAIGLAVLIMQGVILYNLLTK